MIEGTIPTGARRLNFLAATVGLLAAAAGCGGREVSTAQGTSGSACYPNDTCNAGLVCVGGTCRPQGSGDAAPDAGPTDATPPPDVPVIPDLGPLPDCDVPGAPCEVDDPCVIDPICGNDLRCHPQGYQNCDDGLPCTVDQCGGQGRCNNRPEPGFCVVPITAADGTLQMRCVKDGDWSVDRPCSVCDAAASSTGWTPATGGACDDGQPCTKDDYCQDGVCGGTYYGNQCDDGLACTTDACDGQGGCLESALQPDACLINGVCYQAGDKDPQGCSVCDPKASPNSWTPLTLHCDIGGLCYAPGERSPDGCGECDPALSSTDWSPTSYDCKVGSYCYQAGDEEPAGMQPPPPPGPIPPPMPTLSCSVCDPQQSTDSFTLLAGTCRIDMQCHNSGDVDPTGCAMCDPASNPTGWTPVANKCFIDGGCHASGTTHPQGCAVCDPATDPSGWTITTADACLIDGLCYSAGDTDPDTGCGQCAPGTSAVAWTPLSDHCLIGGQCYADQQSDSSGCLVCDASANAGGWTPAPGVTATVHAFDSSASLPAGWSETHDDPAGLIKWQLVTDRRSASSPGAVYYGNPTTGNYDNGEPNSGTLTLSGVALPATGKAGLRFTLWLDVENGTSYDVLEVQVGGQSLWKKNTTTQTPQQSWSEQVVDLSAFAGQTVDVQFIFDTKDSVSNKSEGVYIDNVTIYSGC